MICSLNFYIYLYSKSNNGYRYSRRLSDQIQWGKTFQSIESNIIIRECEVYGHPVCCSLVANVNDSNSNLYERNIEYVKLGYSQHSQHDRKHCPHTREYIPSQYELEHINKAKEFSDIEDVNVRYYKILDYAFSPEQVEHSRNWLKRVNAHMNSSIDAPYHEHDEIYLSRFIDTHVCHNKTFVRTEWIEPLTVHSRHPFAWCHSQCIYPRRKGYCNNLTTFEKETHIVNSDYIIVASSSANNNTEVINDKPHQSKYDKKFLFDAGSSTFNSGLFWFLCVYAQKHIPFNQIYAWEYTLLEPADFWSQVPPILKPLYHFFNVPISSKYDDPDSVLRFIDQIAKSDDFVAFKLDIDTPEIEIPIALYIAEHPEMAKLIDEFFFELHYQCDIMQYCGWSNEMPKEYNGLELSRRDGAMKFFQKLRILGIRAHFWV